jgi:hypothetical protein
MLFPVTKCILLSYLCFCFQLGAVMRCPVTKFITHTTSHICFLVLLAVATFRLAESGVYITSTKELTDSAFIHLSKDEKINSLLKETLRPANTLLTRVQISIVFWILGKYSIKNWQQSFVDLLACKCVDRSTCWMKRDISSYIKYTSVNVSTTLYNDKNCIQSLLLHFYVIKYDENHYYICFNLTYKGNNKITELRTILQRESQNS